MKKITALALLPGFALLLSGCVGGGVTVTDIHQVKQVSLADGSNTKVGFKPPQPSWQCTQVAQSSENWSTDKMKAMTDWHGPYKILQDHAIAYANENNIKTNFIYLKVPVQVQVGSFSANPFAKAYMTFYQCKYPPTVSNKIL